MSETPAKNSFSARIDFADGESLTFDQADAVRKKDYVGAFVTQQCFEVVQGPWRIYFRPDANSDHIDIIVELGRITRDKAAPFNAPAFTFYAFKNGEQIGTLNGPYHRWFTRYRWQNAPRPFISSLEEVAAHPLLPQLDKSLNKNPKSPKKDHKYTGPMSRAGITRNMRGTGDRMDIGVVTEQTARALTTQDDDWVRRMMDNAEAHSSAPCHIRMDNGTPLRHWHGDPDTWDITLYDNSIAKTKRGDLPDDDWIRPDIAHYPSLSLVPYLLTDDPYHLEELQYQVVWHYAWTKWPRTGDRETKGTLAFMEQYRGMAWGLRDIINAHAVTPETVPGWLLPRDYFTLMLGDFEKLFEKIMDGTALRSRIDLDFKVRRDVFRYPVTVKGKAGVQFWQHEYFMNVIGLAILGGYEQFRPMYEWGLESTIQRTNGKSGWDRRWCTPYNITKKFNGRQVTISAAQKTWAEAWDLYVQLHGADRDVDVNRKEDYTLMQKWLDYCDITRANLVVATRLGYDVADSLEFLDYSRSKLISKGEATTAKWCFAVT